MRERTHTVPASCVSEPLPSLPSRPPSLQASRAVLAARATLRLLPAAGVAVAEAWRAAGRPEEADRLVAEVAAHVARQQKQQ